MYATVSPNREKEREREREISDRNFFPWNFISVLISSPFFALPRPARHTRILLESFNQFVKKIFLTCCSAGVDAWEKTFFFRVFDD